MQKLRGFYSGIWPLSLGARHNRDAPVKENDHAMDDIRYFVTTLLPMEEDMGAPVLSVERGG